MTKKPFVLQALDYADPGDLGGASRVALAFSRELQVAGCRVLVFAGCHDRRGCRREDGLSFCFFPALPGGKKTWRTNLAQFWAPQGMLRRMAPGRIDLLACHQPCVTWNVRQYLDHAPMVYFFHSPWPEEFADSRQGGRGSFWLQYGIRRIMERWALRRAARIFVGSDFMAQRLFHCHGRRGLAGKVEKIPFGVDTDFFAPTPRDDARRKLGAFPEGRRILVTVRRLEPRMGLENLLEAFKQCLARFPDLFLVIVGRGGLEARLKAKAASLGMGESVLFWGYADNAALPMLYSAADLFVLPTEALEGFGLVILEALACDTPVLATPVGGIPGVLGGLGEKSLTRDNTAGGIAAGICDAMTELVPLSGRGVFREYVLSHFSWRRYTQRFLDKVRDLA